VIGSQTGAEEKNATGEEGKEDERQAGWCETMRPSGYEDDAVVVVVVMVILLPLVKVCAYL